MSDEGIGANTYNRSSRNSRKRTGSDESAAGAQPGARGYAGGGAAGTRKQDNPGAWVRTPYSRADADRTRRKG